MIGSEHNAQLAGLFFRVKTSQAGFTVIELLLVSAVLMILTLLALPLGEAISIRSKETVLKMQLSKMRKAIDAFKTDWDREGEKLYGSLCQQNKLSCETISGENGYPMRLEDLIQVDYLSGANNRSKHYLRAIPIDPMTGKAAWHLRCYVDEPDAGSWCGDDVFDISSKSEAISRNDVAYRAW